MSFNVEGFRSIMARDGARPNLFECEINYPLGANISNSSTVRRAFRFLCRSASLPGSSMGYVSIPYFGREVKLAGNRVFQDWTVTIINDENFAIKNSFEQWMNAINSHIGNRRFSTLTSSSSYAVDGKVFQYGKTGNKIKEYLFRGMFPIDVSPIDLDWGSNDVVEEFTVTFQYQYWVTNTTDGAALTTTRAPTAALGQ